MKKQNDRLFMTAYVLFIIFLVLLVPPQCFAKTSKKTTAKKSAVMPEIIVLDETAILKNVKNSIYKTFSQIQDPKIDKENAYSELELKYIAQKALAKNISLMGEKIGKDITKSALKKAEAIFDPIFSLSAAYSAFHQNKRTEHDTKYHRPTNYYSGDRDPTPDDDPVYTVRPEFEKLNIEFVRYDEPMLSHYYETDIDANEEAEATPNETTAYGLSVYQNVPWGPYLSLTLLAKDQESYWKNNLDGSWGAYDRPWKSSISESLNLPLPFCKNFGPYAASEVAVLIAKKNNALKRLQVDNVLNQTLLTAESYYWDLVGQVLSLSAIIRHQKLVQTLWHDTEQLYQNRDALKYDLWQVEVEKEGIKEKEQIYRSSVINSATSLQDLINEFENKLILPINFTQLLNRKGLYLSDAYINQKAKENPYLKMMALNVEMAHILFNQAKVQTYPDLKLIQAFSLTQLNSTFGYRHIDESITDLFRQADQIRQDYTLFYQGTLFSRAEEANMERAKIFKDKEVLQYQKVMRLIKRQINDAKARLSISQARVEITKTNLKLSQIAYQEAKEKQQEREISEQEIVYKSIDLLETEKAFIQSMIALKKAEAQLLNAIGELSNKFTSRLAVGPLSMRDQYKTLNLSNDRGELNHDEAYFKN